jgi:hypothetical protein
METEALQLFLIVDFIYDWAQDSYRPAILNQFRLLSLPAGFDVRTGGAPDRRNLAAIIMEEFEDYDSRHTTRDNRTVFITKRNADVPWKLANIYGVHLLYGCNITLQAITTIYRPRFELSKNLWGLNVHIELLNILCRYSVVPLPLTNKHILC